MNAPPLFLVLYATLILVFTTANSAAENAVMSQGRAEIRIEMNAGSITLETNDAPLNEVMQAVGDLAGFKTILVQNTSDTPLVSVSFHNVPVREAVQRLVSDKNSIIIYRSEGDNAAESSIISQVWLLGSGEASGGGEVSDDNNIALALEKDVKDHKLDRLTKMLQEDQELSLRTRAAMAIGALQDERAVPALESALLDTHYSVRLQAINALGRIGGERATTVLGNILLQGSADTSERVMAAQALWKQDSEAARSYLHTGAYDTDQQVRMACSKPPPSSSTKVLANHGQLGDVVAQ